MSERLITMKSRINEQLIKLNSKMKTRLIEKFLTIKKNIEQVKNDVEQIRQNIKKIKKMIEKRIIQIEKKMKLNKNVLHNKIDEFAIDVKNLVVITRNDRLHRFHEVIKHIKVFKFVLDFDIFR
jgi:esterase/lipase